MVHNKNVKIEIIGEFVGSKGPPSLANKVILIPKDDSYNQSYQLMVDREQVSFKGDKCNTIGTSFVAF
jgi:hypothetical protein